MRALYRKQPWLLALLPRSERTLRERRSRRLKVKRAKELELVVVDKRAKRKESRVLDSNGESGDLGGLCLSCERREGGLQWWILMGKAQAIETHHSPPRAPLEESAVVDKGDFLYIGVRVYLFLCFLTSGNIACSILKAKLTAAQNNTEERHKFYQRRDTWQVYVGLINDLKCFTWRGSLYQPIRAQKVVFNFSLLLIEKISARVKVSTNKTI